MEVAEDPTVLLRMEPGSLRLVTQRQLPAWVEQSPGGPGQGQCGHQLGRGGTWRQECMAPAEGEGEHVPV